MRLFPAIFVLALLAGQWGIASAGDSVLDGINVDFSLVDRDGNPVT